MATRTTLKTPLPTTFFTLLSLLIFLSPSLANDDFTSSPCNLTPHPTFCTATLPSPNILSVHDQCRFFLNQSLVITKKVLEMVSSYLRDRRMRIPGSTLHAIEDCVNSAELNIDFLSIVLRDAERTAANSYQAQYYDTQTMLSAVLTNHQTCMDGFNEVTPYPRITGGLSSVLSNAYKLYSVSLALFAHGWVKNPAARPRTTMNRKLHQTNLDGDEGLVVREKVVVNPNGSGDFTTINDAVDAAPNNTGTNNGYHVIYVVAGIYNEYVSLSKNKQNVMIVGDGINRTVITGNRSVVDGWTTFQSATFAVAGKGFVAVNITFCNTAGPAKHQAVAVRNSADMSTFYTCSFEGYQDTLYTHSLRQFYKNCDIYGTVDFIFGNAATLFQDCNIFPRLPMQNQFNAITAQGRMDPNQNTGISIQNSWIVGNDGNYSRVETYLGRPWKEYSRTVYVQCFMDGIVDGKGWVEWNGDFALRTLYFAEFANWGPGSNTTNRVTWEGYHLVDENDADGFTVYNFIQGDSWLPKTGVPFKAGL
ncbi:probable pectinesterase/pectinesterase inhibitor 41 [Arachis stenosperma]|uniref:probable pectinesterase/pectinesterase inhibitor 41 n=1 Tax=Arachis stenosperma TaxID=217475 RepID=UPI0025ABC9CE|nr:probable pectinesterase/pectinesterase inhibitor 41 [Arachis stenosperma]